MGVGIAKRSLIFRIGAGAIKGALALVLFVLVLLIILRVMAAVRENGAEAPPSTVRFQTPTGAVAARLSGPVDGPPIMLIHGTAAWSGFWRQVADHLAGRGWRVIAIDLPPFGWSGRDPEGRYDRATQAERLAAVLRTQSKRAVVVGHSFGAGAATELALRHPDELKGLVLVDAALGEFDAGPGGRSRQGAWLPPARGGRDVGSGDQSRRARAVAAVDDCPEGAGVSLAADPSRADAARRHDFGLCSLAAEPLLEG